MSLSHLYYYLLPCDIEAERLQPMGFTLALSFPRPEGRGVSEDELSSCKSLLLLLMP